MSAFLDVIKREINHIKKSKFLIFALFIMPLFFSFILISTFSSATLKHLPVGVLDLDKSNLSRKIVRMVNSTPSLDIKYSISDYKEGEYLLQKGDIYALLVIPRDFRRDILAQKQPKLIYYYNNQTILIGGIISKDIQSAIITAMVGFDASARMKKGISYDDVMTKVNLLRVDEHTRANSYLNYSYFLTYALLAHNFHVFIVFFAIWALGIEFREGTTKEWLNVADNSIFTAVSGKLFLYGGIMFLLMVFTYGLYIILYGAPLEGNILFILFSTLIFIFSYQMYGLMFVAILSNLRFALSAGAFCVSLGMTFAGMTFPNMSMPLLGQAYSAILPVRPYVNILVDQCMRGFSPKYDLIYLVWIFVLGLLGLCLMPLLKKHSLDEDLWYQI